MSDRNRTVPGSSSPGELEEEIRTQSAAGRISCRAAFGLAERRGISVSEIGRLIDEMGIKIVACQLGCFK